MPKMEYPAFFEGGLIGTKCIEDIKHREAYLFVPLKIMMTIDKVLNHPVLSGIVAAHPEAFSEEDNQDYEQLSLCLFLFYEMSLGQKSFWYPYLRLMPIVEFTCLWDEKEIQDMDDF